ncbi:CoA transferase [Ramlibacter sp. RBP-2]|uniref:CoA transferase n=1 Tax=Ramlibacter lithotrophicus TaxID=2606681 RepID=A0A7X6I905_9BURK|nr:CoA transferase [Ramlibacter lithotrophicus]NKE68871.1 CoA transferase [Ramlibacter lithotrophicus]
MPTAAPVLSAHTPRESGSPAALAGIRVLDFTRLIAGPYGTMLLADLGADVIKVENPLTGDDARGLKPPSLGGESSLYIWTNRNKRSIAIDLRLPQGQELAQELAAHADVVVENFSTGVMEKLNLSYDTLRACNPRLIYCSVSAFGRQGAFAHRPGYDPVVQAETGFLSMNGFPDQDPVRAGPSVIDISTGMMTSNAILAALMARERHGIGQYVEVTMFDDAIALTGQYGMNYLMTGEDQQRPGNGSNTAEPVGLFPTTNGPLYLTCANDRNFQKLVLEVLERPELAQDERFRTNAGRMMHRKELHEVLRGHFRERGREEWLKRGHECGVPMGLVRTIREAFDSDEMRERRLLSKIPHPTAGEVPNIAPPFHFSETPIVNPVAAPLLGEHTDRILTELLQASKDRLAGLKAAGVFGDRS